MLRSIGALLPDILLNVGKEEHAPKSPKGGSRIIDAQARHDLCPLSLESESRHGGLLRNPDIYHLGRGQLGWGDE